MECFHNVKTYSMYFNGNPDNIMPEHKQGLEITVFEPTETVRVEPKIFICFETIFHEAFAHWIYESFIFLIKYHPQLKHEFPGIKIHVNIHKNYKMLFLKKIGIPEEDIHIGPLPKNNVCYFLPVVTMHNNWRQHEVIELLPILKGIDSNNYDKTIDILVMPRQKIENYVHNDKNYNGVEDIYLGLKNTGYNCQLLNTDNLTDVSEQIRLLRSSKVIILTGGSPSLVNPCFCQGSTIIVCGYIFGQLKQKCLKSLLEDAKKYNCMYLLPENSNYINFYDTDIVPIIKKALLA